MNGLWLVSYDISEDNCRKRVHTILKNYGKRVQYSVFECYLKDHELTLLRARLMDEIDSGDSLRWYPLCTWCAATVFFQGTGQSPEDERFFLQ